MTKGATYIFHSAARSPNDPRSAETVPARVAILARHGAHEKDWTAPKAAAGHAPA